MTNLEPLLEVKHLKTYFPIRKGLLRRATGYVRAVVDVSFEVEPGETFAVVGESGCGKSTMGRSILRLVEPTGGEVFFRGTRLNNMSFHEMRQVRREMQIVFQDPYSSLNPNHRVRSLLVRPMEIHKLYNKHQRLMRAGQILERCGLGVNSLRRYPSEFSGGQRQRIGIARALTLNPSFMVLDEPVSALDVSVQAQILNLLQDLQDELNLTYLFISHDLSVVRHISNRVLVMYLGSMMELAQSKQLFENPLHPYTKALLSAIPIPDLRARRERIILKGSPPSPVSAHTGCPFYTRCHRAMDVCKSVVPAWTQVEPNHFVACHLYSTAR